MAHRLHPNHQLLSQNRAFTNPKSETFSCKHVLRYPYVRARFAENTFYKCESFTFRDHPSSMYRNFTILSCIYTSGTFALLLTATLSKSAINICISVLYNVPLSLKQKLLDNFPCKLLSTTHTTSPIGIFMQSRTRYGSFL